MNKQELREKYKIIRQNINDRINKDNQIFYNVINNDNVINSNTILIYMPLKYEVSTISIINYFIKDKRIAIPKVNNDTMDFYIIGSLSDTSKGSFNIMEPTTNNMLNSFDNSVIIVPGICFSKDGYRIGYGKGYYDKFLNDKDIYSIGITYDECLINYIPHEEHDIKLNKIITSKKC